MPSVAARDYRGSWEIPYDFHPRIHAYPGAKSVVRAYMDSGVAATRSASREDKVNSELSATKNSAKKVRHYRLRPSPPPSLPQQQQQNQKQQQRKAEVVVQQTLWKEEDAAERLQKKPDTVLSATPLPSTPHPPSRQQQQRRRPLWRAARQNAVRQTRNVPDNTDTSNKQFLTSPVKSTVLLTAEATSTSEKIGRHNNVKVRQSLDNNKTRVRPLPSTAAQEAQPSRCLRPSSFSCQSRVVSVGQERDSVEAPPSPQPPQQCLSTNTLPPAQAHYGYRTNPHYSLPPSYTAQQRGFAAQPVPTVNASDRYTKPPSSREFRLRGRRLRVTNRRGVVEELHHCLRAQEGSSDRVDYIPRVVLERYLDVTAADTFQPAAHNYNAVVPDAFASSVAERAARLRSTEERMWERLVIRVAPLSEAQDAVVGCGGGTVLDSGHVTDPIYVTENTYNVDLYDKETDGNCVNAAPRDASCTCDEGTEAQAFAVVVQPLASEVPSSAEALREAEARRRWPKGREWDRQAAIRAAVGPTAQEALVDLGIDPRYRQPGDFLLRRNRSC